MLVHKNELEYGSFYSKCDIVESSEPWFNTSHTIMTSCGRDALYLILFYLKSYIDKSSLSNNVVVWMPSYYCHPITDMVSRHYTVRIYDSSPQNLTKLANNLCESDILVLVEYFGEPNRLNFSGKPHVLLDKTHNPVANHLYEFNVHYEFGSLRKLLPVADGGYIICKEANVCLDLLKVTDYHKEVFNATVLAQDLKRRYLDNLIYDKSEFLKLFNFSEQSFGCLENPSAPISKNLNTVDLNYYVQSRKNNSDILLGNIDLSNEFVNVFISGVFFGLLFDSSSHRDKAKFFLINSNIYPAVFWPPDELYMNLLDLDFSSRVLFVPNDFRYGANCMLNIATLLNKFLRECNG